MKKQIRDLINAYNLRDLNTSEFIDKILALMPSKKPSEASGNEAPKTNPSKLSYEERCEIAKKAALTRKRRAAARKAVETKKRNALNAAA